MNTISIPGGGTISFFFFLNSQSEPVVITFTYVYIFIYYSFKHHICVCVLLAVHTLILVDTLSPFKRCELNLASRAFDSLNKEDRKDTRFTSRRLKERKLIY